MPDQTDQAMPIDTLTGMAKLLTDLHQQLDTRQRAALAARTRLAPTTITAIVERAQQITRAYDQPGDHQGENTPLERSPTDPDMFTLTARRAVWIGVEDPNRPGRGFDIHIRDDGDGPTIDVWHMNDADIPGIDQGPVPYEPITSLGLAYNNHLAPDLDEKLARA